MPGCVEAVGSYDDQAQCLELLLAFVVRAMLPTPAVLTPVDLCDESGFSIEQVHDGDQPTRSVEHRHIDERTGETGASTT
jgi:hypothetical protein